MAIEKWIMLGFALLSPWYTKRVAIHLQSDALRRGWPAIVSGSLLLFLVFLLPMCAGSAWEKHLFQGEGYVSGGNGALIMVCWAVIVFQLFWHDGYQTAVQVHTSQDQDDSIRQNAQF